MPPEGCSDELGEGIGSHNNADHGRCRFKALSIKRQQWNDDAKADQVNEDNQKQRKDGFIMNVQDYGTGPVIWR